MGYAIFIALLRDIFLRPTGRGVTGLLKNRITDETLKLLSQLAEEAGLRARIDAMSGGEARLPCGRSRPDLVAAACRRLS